MKLSFNVNSVTSSIAAAYDNTRDAAVTCVAATKEFVLKAATQTAEGIELAAVAVYALVEVIIKMAWWIVTLPARIAFTIFFYVALYIMGKVMQNQMAKAEEELRFHNAKPVNAC